MDEETIKERLKALSPELRTILYYRCPATLKQIPDIARLMGFSVPSINNRIRSIKNGLGSETFDEDICRVLYQEYGGPPYRDQPDPEPDPDPDPEPEPEPDPEPDPIEEFFTRQRTGVSEPLPDPAQPPQPPPPGDPNWLENAINRFRGPRAIGLALFFGLAGLIVIVIVCFVAYGLLQVIKGDWPPTRQPTVVALATYEPDSTLDPELTPTIDIPATQSRIAEVVFETMTAEAPLPTFTLTEFDPPTKDPAPTLPRPADTPQPTNTPRPTIAPSPTPIPFPLPFIDNFEQGLNPEWKVVQGQPLILNGWLGAPLDGVTLEIGDNSLGDYAVEFDYDISLDGYDITFANSVLLEVSRGVLYWKGNAGGDWTTLYYGHREGIGTDGTLRIVKTGNSYQTFLNGLPHSSITYGLAGQGPLRIFIDYNEFIDNFSITPN